MRSEGDRKIHVASKRIIEMIAYRSFIHNASLGHANPKDTLALAIWTIPFNMRALAGADAELNAIPPSLWSVTSIEGRLLVA